MERSRYNESLSSATFDKLWQPSLTFLSSDLECLHVCMQVCVTVAGLDVNADNGDRREQPGDI